MTIKLCRHCKHIGDKLPNEGFICLNIELRMMVDHHAAGKFLVNGEVSELAKIKCETARKYEHWCGIRGRLFEV